MTDPGATCDPEVSALDELAGLAVRLVLAGAVKKPAAMLALSRLAMDEFAVLEGHANAAQHHARQSRIHQERSTNLLRKGVRRG